MTAIEALEYKYYLEKSMKRLADHELENFFSSFSAEDFGRFADFLCTKIGQIWARKRPQGQRYVLWQSHHG